MMQCCGIAVHVWLTAARHRDSESELTEISSGLVVQFLSGQFACQHVMSR